MQKANYFCTALLLLALLVFAVPRVHAGHTDGGMQASAATVITAASDVRNRTTPTPRPDRRASPARSH